MPKDNGIGASPKRREDVRFLTGAGNYTDDINVHGQAHVHFLRADAAHATINSIDTSAAEAMPGVVKIFTGADFAEVGGIPCGWGVPDRHGNPQQEPRHPIIADGTIRHVGEIVAAVVADTLEQARDAAEAIELDLGDKPAVVDMAAALGEGSTKVHEDLTSNL
ncbi:MAG: xanthine dehydrogenase family protein molybdopterin-binding subunit, partial [Leisingera sp.]